MYADPTIEGMDVHFGSIARTFCCEVLKGGVNLPMIAFAFVVANSTVDKGEYLERHQRHAGGHTMMMGAGGRRVTFFDVVCYSSWEHVRT